MVIFTAKKSSIILNGSKKVGFNEDDGKEYDDYGVLCGIRNHSFHYNKKKIELVVIKISEDLIRTVLLQKDVNVVLD